MEAICSTGIRVSEVQYLTVEAAQRGKAEIRMKGKLRTILIPKKLCRKLLKYAKKHKATPQNTQKERPCGKIPPGRAYIRHSISAAAALI